MKTVKKGFAFVIMLTIALCFSTTVFGAAGNIETEKNSSLEIIFRDGEKAIPDAEFSVYLIADIDERGKYTVTEEFKGFNVNITGKNDAAWHILASTLEGYILQSGLAPTASGKTGSEGILKLGNLKPGLYIILGTTAFFDEFTYFTETAIVQIPVLDHNTNTWNYEVSVKPKYSFIPDVGPDGFIERKVLKVWDDKGYSALRPKEITVYLLCDGEIFDTVKLNKENNWRHTWDKLDEGYRWTVTERVPEGYTVEIEKKGITFVVTNSIDIDPPPDKPKPEKPDKPKPEEPKLPQTGQLWWPVPVLSSSGVLFVAVGIVRKRRSHEE